MRPRFEAPVCVGGVGGSGTRVVAQVLDGLGVHMGHYLNHARDNLLFHALVVRRPWLERELDGDGRRLGKRLKDFGHASVHPGQVGLGARLALTARSRNPRQRWHQTRARLAGVWAGLRDARRAGDPEGLGYAAWGWKEPNTHLVLRQVAAVFPQAHYIHLVRHGLDMAFSANQGQLQRWGPLFGVDPRPDGDDLPERALKYWIAGNQAAIATMEASLPGRHHVVRFIDMCERPEAFVEDLRAFVGVDVGDDVMSRLATIPKTPPSVGRYKEHDLDRFDEADLRAVERLGFPIEA